MGAPQKAEIDQNNDPPPPHRNVTKIYPRTKYYDTLPISLDCKALHIR